MLYTSNRIVGSNPTSPAVLARSTTVVRQTVNLLVAGSNPAEPVPSWCNGSTGDFGPPCLGSNPSEGIFVCKEPVQARFQANIPVWKTYRLYF